MRIQSRELGRAGRQNFSGLCSLVVITFYVLGADRKLDVCALFCVHDGEIETFSCVIALEPARTQASVLRFDLGT